MVPPALSAPQDRNIAATFAKGMAVLAAFDGNTQSLTLADLARRTGQDRATVRRGALTLVHLGYLRAQDRQFSLTAKVLALSGAFLQANLFGRQIQPVLNQHAARLGAEVTLAIQDGDSVLLLAQSTAGLGPVSYGFTPGSRLPLLHTSLGRMLLACLPDDQAQSLIQSGPIPRHTEQSLTDADAILDRVRLARQDGFIVTDSEFEAGIVGLAVPLSRPGATGVVVGSSTPRGGAGAGNPDATAPRDQDHMLQVLQRCAAELRQSGGLDWA